MKRLTKITKAERLELLGKNGWYRAGHLYGSSVGFLANPTKILDQLTPEFTEKVRQYNELITIKKIRSRDFIDSENCYYEFKGETYLYNDSYIFHVAYDDSRQPWSTSIALLAN